MIALRSPDGSGRVLHGGLPLRKVISAEPITRELLDGRTIETVHVRLLLECGCVVRRARPIPHTAKCEVPTEHGG